MKSTQRVTLRQSVRPQPGNVVATRSKALVITLCALPVAITIARPRSQYLSEVSFFSSRRAGRRQESYWVHLGYFSSRAEAQRWLKIVQSDYPNAFVREARSLVAHQEVQTPLPPAERIAPKARIRRPDKAGAIRTVRSRPTNRVLAVNSETCPSRAITMRDPTEVLH